MKIKPLFLLFIVVLLSCEEGHDEYYAEPEIDYAYYAERFKMSEEHFHRAIAIGLIDTGIIKCSHEIQALPNERISSFGVDTSKVLEQSLVELSAYLYRLFGDALAEKQEQILYEEMDLETIIAGLQRGDFTPQCEDISAIAQRIILNGPLPVECSLVRTYTVAHTLNILSYERGGKAYQVFADFQNGFFYPSYSKDSLVVPSINDFLQNDKKDSLSFYWLPEEVLNQKRNFSNDILPCNFLPQMHFSYRMASKKSPYRFELLGQSYHKLYWFDLGQTDVHALKKELNAYLIASTSDEAF